MIPRSHVSEHVIDNGLGWPPLPEPVYCAICRESKVVWSILASADEIDVELVCNHRVLTTTRKRGTDGAP
jgi:hypothetical protein